MEDGGEYVSERVERLMDPVNAKSFLFDLPFGSTNNFRFKADPKMSTNR